MAELATVARPYAEALFQSAAGDLDGTTQWLDALAAVAGDAQLQQFADNPKVDHQQVFDLVAAVARVPLPEAGPMTSLSSSRTPRSATAPSPSGSSSLATRFRII